MNSPIPTTGFWHYWQEINRSQSIFHQWEQLELSGCIDNFRILAEKKPVFREGWFFADSDAYKWLEAASRILQDHPNPQLTSLVDQFISLLINTQDPDGYLYTYNQVHFPGHRWFNLQIEHELYCHGHLIEAGVSHFLATGRQDLLQVAEKAADRIVEDFSGKGPRFTPGHEEIEIALLRLYEFTRHPPHLALARQFLDQRGRDKRFGFHLFQQNASVAKRSKLVLLAREKFRAEHPDSQTKQIPAGNYAKKSRFGKTRYLFNAISGRLLQQHKPLSKQNTPEGHAVRFAYLQTASAMAARLSGDLSDLPRLEQVWERMVTRRMYPSGGIGSRPEIEGFGRDYELDPELAYAETCAALGSIFWNHEMALLTNKAQHSDLLEWQLYNAALVGLAVDGKSYLYNNPLACHGGITRKPWYAVPCCPSNLSRTLAQLEKYQYTETADDIHVHQYFSTSVKLNDLNIDMNSEFPWDGNVNLHLEMSKPQASKIHLRLPSWCPSAEVSINEELIGHYKPLLQAEITAAGIDPRVARWITLDRVWNPADEITIHFEMPVRPLIFHPGVKSAQNKTVVTRGPLLYCLESIDNPEADIFSSNLDITTLKAEMKSILGFDYLELVGLTQDKTKLRLIPYFLWANRGKSKMTGFTPKREFNTKLPGNPIYN